MSTPIGIRFAPSPTGAFHVGNLRTAWIAHQIAENLNEPLIIRFEDIDKARVVKDAQSLQMADMAALGINSHRVEIQSERIERHRELFERAVQSGLVYACDCSRTEVRQALREISSAPHGREPEYSGHCRALSRSTLEPSSLQQKSLESVAWRWRHEDESGRFDSIIARTDLKTGEFQPGYHWACAVDDADGRFLCLVRAWDLAAAEETQSRIRSWILGENGSTDGARVFHTSLVTKNDGHRLEKRTLGVTLNELLANGYTCEKIVDLFQASFTAPSAERIKGPQVSVSPLLGESRRELTLRELGFIVAAIHPE